MFVLKALITLGIELIMAQEIVSIWLRMSISKSVVQWMTHAKPQCILIGYVMVASNSTLPENVINFAQPNLMEKQIVTMEHPSHSFNIKTVLIFAPETAAITIQTLSMQIQN